MTTRRRTRLQAESGGAEHDASPPYTISDVARPPAAKSSVAR